ncbi:hypothetical protein FOZ62_000422 [Perkinsus olseni]|uniref:Uncharacterized protein n=1 Tax=Perkinsus olseni TaxID=32597 RepID=A0A7J6RX31_PEROL|nr:hypothetical protein FOZ62_000422 [Perkinsus olseni]
MMSLAQFWLMAAQLLVLVTSQDVGRFAYYSKDFNMSYSVFEEQSVAISFTVDGKPSFADGLYRLQGSFVSHLYVVDFRNTYEGVTWWYRNINRLFPGSNFRYGDLFYLFYKTADSFVVNFRERGILLTRVGLDLIPGLYVYTYPAAPYFKVVHDIYYDGHVLMQVGCDGGSISYGAFKFNRQDGPYLHYNVDPVEQGDLNKFLDDFKKSCPSLDLKKNVDLSRVTFATGETVIIAIAGTRQLLRRVL